jgi:hypothetical protein
MKEYILVTIIASVGIVGLLSIHHDVEEYDGRAVAYFQGQAFGVLHTSEKPSDSTDSQMIIDQESHWPLVAIRISHFDCESEYYLDPGFGEKRKITQPGQTLEFSHSGTYFVKLIKDHILIDAIELVIDVEEQDKTKLVSF